MLSTATASFISHGILIDDFRPGYFIFGHLLNMMVPPSISCALFRGGCDGGAFAALQLAITTTGRRLSPSFLFRREERFSINSHFQDGRGLY